MDSVYYSRIAINNMCFFLVVLDIVQKFVFLLKYCDGAVFSFASPFSLLYNGLGFLVFFFFYLHFVNIFVGCEIFC